MVKNCFLIHIGGNRLWKYLVLCIVTVNISGITARNPIYIGGFFPLSPNKASVPGYALLASARLALEHVSNSNILEGYELQMIVKDSKVSRIHFNERAFKSFSLYEFKKE